MNTVKLNIPNMKSHHSWWHVSIQKKQKIMNTVKLNIPNMKSHHCQMTVTAAVEAIGGSVKSMAPTLAEIELVNGLTKTAVVRAIELAGYKVTD